MVIWHPEYVLTHANCVKPAQNPLLADTQHQAPSDAWLLSQVADPHWQPAAIRRPAGGPQIAKQQQALLHSVWERSRPHWKSPRQPLKELTVLVKAPGSRSCTTARIDAAGVLDHKVFSTAMMAHRLV